MFLLLPFSSFRRSLWVLVLFSTLNSAETVRQPHHLQEKTRESSVVETLGGPRSLVSGPRTPVNPANSGYSGEVVASADPESQDNLIVCGFRENQRTGAAYEGYVYQSRDRGMTWQEVLVDANSQWVSEESCAFGPSHLAYFAAGVANTSHGLPQDGNLFLYRSLDGGHQWQSIQVDRFLDYMALAVDATHGPLRGTLYIFANLLGDDSDNQTDKTPFLATRREIGAPSFAITSGNFNSGVAGVRFPAKYPRGATVLNDGTAVAIFMGDREVADPATNKTTTLFSVEVGLSRDGGKTLHKRLVYEDEVPPVATGLAFDAVRRALYVCWTPRYGQSKESKLMLGISKDNGETWTVKAVKPPVHDGLDVRAGSASLAVNDGGILGFMWYGANGRSAYFGISTDEGDSLAKVITLTPPIDLRQDPLLADDRRLFVSPPRWNVVPGRSEPLRVLTLGPNLAGVPFGNALVADSGGAFHPVWNEVANGVTNLWTRTISLRNPQQISIAPTLDGLVDISDKVVTHISNVRFDHLESLVAFDITVTNKSQTAIAGPIFVSAAVASLEPADFAGNADTASHDGRALWELRTSSDGLSCEHSTEPRTLIFRMVSKSGDELDIPLKIYGKLQ